MESNQKVESKTENVEPKFWKCGVHFNDLYKGISDLKIRESEKLTCQPWLLLYSLGTQYTLSEFFLIPVVNKYLSVTTQFYSRTLNCFMAVAD